MHLNAHYKRNKPSHGDTSMSKLKNQMIFTQCSYIFTSTYIEFNINKKSHNHKGLTFDSNIIKSATLILLSKVELSRTIDQSRFWRVFASIHLKICIFCQFFTFHTKNNA